MFPFLVKQAATGLQGPEQRAWSLTIEEDRDNLREAIASSLAYGRLQVALRLVAGLTIYLWERRAGWQEMRSWLDQVITRSKGLVVPERAQALFASGFLVAMQGEALDASALLGQAVELARRVNDRKTLALALSSLAWVRVMHGQDVDACVALGEEGVGVARELGDAWVLAESLNNLSGALGEHTHSERAVSLIRESLQLRRFVGDTRGIVEALNNLGWDALLNEDYEHAAQCLEESLEAARRLDVKQHIAMIEGNLALIRLFEGDPHRAEGLFLGSLSLSLEIGDRRLWTEGLMGLAGVAALEADWTDAAWFAGASGALATELELLPNDVFGRIDERFLTKARNAIGVERFEAEFDRGRLATFEDAVAQALGNTFTG